jgi:DNA-directed RNA polymerase specialized sigma24 family protein
VDGIRLAAIGEPDAAPASGPAVLDHVLASRLERAGPTVRWGIGAGRDDATAEMRARLALRRAQDDALAIGFATGDPWRDALLMDLGVALGALLDDLTVRQAEIAALILVDGARQVDVAASLGVSRATVSVAVARGRLRAIAGVRHAIEELLAGPPPAGSRRGPAGMSPPRT